jgi:hypothetical protein
VPKDPNQLPSKHPKTPEEIYFSDRGERKYYKSKKSLSERVRLPLTKDGIETILELTSEALGIPLDDNLRLDFAGYVHHTAMNENSFTFGELGKVFWNRFSKRATWTYDQEAKERMKIKAEADKVEAERQKPTLVKDEQIESKSQGIQ